MNGEVIDYALIPAGEKPSSVKRWDLLTLFGILLLTILSFWPTFSNGFQMEWDDQWMVMNSLTTHPIDGSYIVSILFLPFNGQEKD